MMRSRRFKAVVAICLISSGLIVVACVGDDAGTTSATGAGQLGKICNPNNTCNATLVCVQNTCVSTDGGATASSSSGGTSSSSSGASGTDGAISDTSTADAPKKAPKDASACPLQVTNHDTLVSCTNVLTGPTINCDPTTQWCCVVPDPDFGDSRTCEDKGDDFCKTKAWSCENRATCPNNFVCCADVANFGPDLDACSQGTATHSECHATSCANSTTTPAATVELCDPAATQPCGNVAQICLPIHVNINSTNPATKPDEYNIVGACVDP